MEKATKEETRVKVVPMDQKFKRLSKVFEVSFAILGGAIIISELLRVFDFV